MNIRAELQQLVSDALGQLDITVLPSDVPMEYPSNLSVGDFACPIALRIAKQQDCSPMDIAGQIVEKITDMQAVGIRGSMYLNDGTDQLAESAESTVLQDIEVVTAQPGYINFVLSRHFWGRLKQHILAVPDSWGARDTSTGQTCLLEHSSPNMFKPFHVGHLVNNFVGESLRRIIVASGVSVTTVSFPSDVSPGIAKAVWGLVDAGITDNITIEQIGTAYVHGCAAYTANESTAAIIDQINIDLYNKTAGQYWDIYERGLEMSYAYFNAITQRLGSRFDGFITESESEIEGKKIVQDNTPAVFTPSQGAIIFEGSRYGLFDNVFVNSQGFGTYLCKDIGLLSKKFAAYTFDQSITVTDIEQKQHFQLVCAAAAQVHAPWAEQSTYVHHGRMSLTSGKISSRGGGVPLASDVLDDVKQRVAHKNQASSIVWDDDCVDQYSEIVAQSALKYAILKSAIGTNISFDLEQDLLFEGATGPYLQYVYVRANSAADKAQRLVNGNSSQVRDKIHAIPDVERLLLRFPDMIEKSFHTHSPHHIAVYLHELASAFNSFYASTVIADEHNVDIRVNIELARTVAVTLHRGLYLLGIDVVESM